MRIVVVLAVCFALLAAFVMIRTALVASFQLDVEPVQTIEIDREQAVERLARVIRFKTISYQDRERVDAAEFLSLHEYLERAFPRVHAALEKEIVGDYSLLYTWRGTSPELKPMLLMGHMDVVPVEPGTESEWTYPPFEGEVANGFIWGRGALDMKQTIIAYLESVEWLLERGFQPRRTVYLALHHDEEIGGRNGALKIAELLNRRSVRLAFTLDEGSAITHGIVPGVGKPVALIALAEKGYLTLELTAKGEGGHSSMPPQSTAVGKLGRAIHRLETRQMPAELRPPASGMFDYLAPEMPLVMRAVVANRWLFEPLLLSRLEKTPATNAIIRTTTAPTMLHRAGVKENALPIEAEAVVNFRLLPGDTIDRVVEHVRTTIDDADVAIRKVGHSREASPVSGNDSSSFVALHETIRQVFPDVVVAPSLVMGGTDSKHYVAVADSSYRFLPIRLTSEDLKRIHGSDERIAVTDYIESIRFYVQLLRNAAATQQGPE